MDADITVIVWGAWGLAGAFIWAWPEWNACAFSGKREAVRCAVQFAGRLACGGLAAAAFTALAADILKVPGHMPAVAAGLGLVANRAAPKLAQGVADVLSKWTKEGKAP